MIESLIDLYKDMEYKNPKGTKMLLVLVIASTLCIVYIFVSGIGGIVSNIFAPRITYIGQIEKIQVEEGQVSLTVRALAGEDKDDWLNNLLLDQRPSWTNVKYPEEIEGKMKKYFKNTFTLEVDGELEYEVGDKVKIVAKNFKIKSISKANEHDIENATIPIVTGIVEKYEKNSKGEYKIIVEVENPDVVDIKNSSVELMLTKEQFEKMNVDIGELIKVITK